MHFVVKSSGEYGVFVGSSSETSYGHFIESAFLEVGILSGTSLGDPDGRNGFLF